MLLGHNADPNQAKTTDGTTPLYTAAAYGLWPRWCCNGAAGAQRRPPGNDMLTIDGHGYTPLIVAVQFGQLEVVAALLAGNADFTLGSTDSSHWTLYPWLSTKAAPPSPSCSSSTAPLLKPICEQKRIHHSYNGIATPTTAAHLTNKQPNL